MPLPGRPTVVADATMGSARLRISHEAVSLRAKALSLVTAQQTIDVDDPPALPKLMALKALWPGCAGIRAKPWPMAWLRGSTQLTAVEATGGSVFATGSSPEPHSAVPVLQPVKATAGRHRFRRGRGKGKRGSASSWTATGREIGANPHGSVWKQPKRKHRRR